MEKKKVSDVENLNEFLEHSEQIGFQASHIGIGRKILKEMKCQDATIYFGFTANLVACGLRGYIYKLVEKGFCDVIVTTGGAIDHDVIKSFSDYYLGSFDMDDDQLHHEGLNRLGNILIGNDRYEMLESISKVVFEEIFRSKRDSVTPSELAEAYGRYIIEHGRKKGSFLAAAAERKIPVFSPGIVDAAIGLNAYFYRQSSKGKKFVIDPIGDLIKLGNITLNAEKTGALILGGGITKHHILGANILRNGLDYAVYVTSGGEYDGSLSGARTKEGISWGKVKEERGMNRQITIHCEATVAVPLLLEGIV